MKQTDPIKRYAQGFAFIGVLIACVATLGFWFSKHIGLTPDQINNGNAAIFIGLLIIIGGIITGFWIADRRSSAVNSAGKDAAERE